VKKILLMRHAKSSWKDSDLTDHERPLKKRGKKDAEKMGKLLKKKKLIPELILSSTAKRAKQTAEIIVDSCKCKAEIVLLDSLYLAEPSLILETIEDVKDKHKTIMVVGHNPGIEAFLQILDGKVESLPTGSVAYLSAKVKNWKDLAEDDGVKLKKLWRPKDL